jgi:ADP-ribose pyrophosphatase YjhB (NUDIX family)
MRTPHDIVRKCRDTRMKHDHSSMHEQPVFQFCPVCGSRLKSLKLKEHEPQRLVCSQCDYIFYLNPKLVASSVVELDGKIVLIKRAIEPQVGKWAVPGGYVDQGEKVEAAAQRETDEECGLKIRIKELLGVYSYPGRPIAVVVYVAEYVSGDQIVGDEVQEVRLFHKEEIPWDDLAFSSTADALRDYFNITRTRRR